MVNVSKAKDYRSEWKKEKYKNVDGALGRSGFETD